MLRCLSLRLSEISWSCSSRRCKVNCPAWLLFSVVSSGLLPLGVAVIKHVLDEHLDSRGHLRLGILSNDLLEPSKRGLDLLDSLFLLLGLAWLLFQIRDLVIKDNSDLVHQDSGSLHCEVVDLGPLLVFNHL